MIKSSRPARRRVLAVLIGCSALAVAVPLRAATPSSGIIHIGEVGSPSATWTGPALIGNPDPLGPPTPTPPGCNSGSPVSNGCDRFSFTLSAPAGYTGGNVISVTATVLDLNTASNFDIAILDGSNSVLAQTISAPGGTTPGSATATDLAPGNYVVEVDGDIGDPTDTGYSGSVTASSVARVAQPGHPNGGITAGRETVADPYRLGTEPTIAVSPDGTVYEGPIFGFSTTQSFVQRSDNNAAHEGSSNGGQTFNTLGVPGAGKTTSCPGGGDEDISTDLSNNLYFLDLGGAPVVPAAVSPDHGNTFISNCIGNDTATNPGRPAHFPDRQWLSTDTVHNVEWYIWRDGVVSASTPVDPFAGPVYGEYIESAPLPGPVPSPAGASQLLFTHLCTNGTGQGVVCIPDVAIAGNAVTDNTPGHPGSGNTYLAMTGHGGIGVAVINPTAVTHVVERTAVPGGGAVLFPTVAVDKAGNVYETYTDSSTYKVKFTMSRDQGATWTAPIVVNGAPAAVTVMPWIIAGDGGRVDIVFYGSPDTHPPTINSGPWNVYMLQDLNATTLTPSFTDWTQAQMTDRPNHVDPVCLSGLGCTTNTGPGGDRELGDFFRVQLDSDGRAVVSFADGNNQLGQEVSPGSPTAAPSFAGFLRQATGPSLYGTGMVPAISVPTNSVSVGPHNDPIPFASPAGPGPNVDALNLLSSSASVGPGPDGTDVHVHLVIKNLSATGAVTAPALANSTFLTRWWFGGKLWFVAAEYNGAVLRMYSGQAAPVSDGLAIKYAYYPATGAASGPAPTMGPNGTLDLYVATSLVGNPTSSDILYSVTSYTNTHALPTAPTPPTASNFTDFPQIVDVLPPYNVVPLGSNIPDAPWAPLLIVTGVGAITLGLWRRRGPHSVA